MKTVLFLFTIFILESFSDRKVYLIETEDDEGKTSGGISEIEEEKSRGTNPKSSKNSSIKSI